jgi:hypothetical protein
MELKITKQVFDEAVIVNGKVEYERKWKVVYKMLGHIYFLLCRVETYIEREYWKKFKFPLLDDKDIFQVFLKADKRKWPVAKYLYLPSKYVTFLKHHAMEWTAIEAIYTENDWLQKKVSIWERFVTSILCRVENIVATRNRLRNTKREMFWEILDQLRHDKDEIRIVSLASGSARSSIEVIAAILKIHPELLNRFKLWFVDADPKAYDFAKQLAAEKFPGLEQHLEFWQTKISGKAEGLKKLSEFLAKIKPTIVEMVGFGDYLSDEKAIGIFSAIYANLEPGGLLITNNVKPNDEQRFLEVVVTWTMINREEEAVLANLAKAGFVVVKTLNEPTDIQTVYAARKP